MAGTPYLVDSNILLRWVKPDHNDYPLVVSAIDAILRRNDVLCYSIADHHVWRQISPGVCLCLPKSLSGANAFEISDIQESET